MPKIIVPDDEPTVLAGTVAEERLRRLGEVRIYDSRALSDEELLRRIADADIALNIRATSVFSRNVLEHCSRLKLISIYGVGFDNVDIKAATELGITVTNTPGYSAVAVGEMALTLMLAVARRIVQNDRTIRSGEWARGYSLQLCGKTLGVIGTGNIGQRMIQLGKSIGMKVIAWTFNPSPERAARYGVEFVALDELLRQSDVVSVHVLGSPQASNLIGKRELRLMKPTAILINTARGSAVNEPALVEALASGVIAGAGLDVFAVEPLPPDHPLRRLENVVLSPHTAAMVPEATLAGLAMSVDNIKNFLQGKATNVVQPAT
ncbi:MAG: glycerate dehydrogenase [Chloroflexi bacterium]|nr:glycerate dehydrogenase [Chloroflexota bacterium]